MINGVCVEPKNTNKGILYPTKFASVPEVGSWISPSKGGIFDEDLSDKQKEKVLMLSQREYIYKSIDALRVKSIEHRITEEGLPFIVVFLGG